MSLDEDDLTRMLQESVEDLQPPVPAMLTEAGRSGRRRIRVRRTLQAAGAATTVAALVAVGTLVGHGSGSGTGVQAAAASSPRASVGAVSSPTAAPTTATGLVGAAGSAGTAPTAGAASPTADLTWQATLKILSDLLPPGAKLADLDPVMTRSGDHYSELQVEYDDGAGASTVSLTMQPTPTSGMIGAVTDCTNFSATDEGPRKPGYEPAACRLTQLPDGSKVLSITHGVDAVGYYDNSVRLTRPNGDYVQIQVGNGTLGPLQPTHPGSNITVTRDKPPLDAAALAAIAENSVWQFKIPQSLADSGAAFARTVSEFPCPTGAGTHCVSA
ncbi:hypothetical protein [Kitasatospora viridis]|uniref:Uncharacterized protein n=1 Tax=Kitasatospora viridis TaxID=281105 RepID=A0A561UPF7_9ACTN|nr:hypothetical protein [Kitasatospora viridis]TWG01231.1 hypothetical protein FHX73_115123 [Kitasatospora viridis]